MISRRHRCIFVHIPKCAGSTVEAILWPPPRRESDLWMGFVDEHHNRHQTGGLQHLLARQIRAEVGRRRFDAYFKFTFVRNPFDRLVSQYEYMARREDLRRFIDLPDGASFSEYLARIQRREHVQWMPQHRFVEDDDGTDLVDFIGRFERFEDDLRAVLTRLGLGGATIPHKNPTTRRPYREYYSEDDRAVVEAMFAVDLERFDYSF